MIETRLDGETFRVYEDGALIVEFEVSDHTTAAHIEDLCRILRPSSHMLVHQKFILSDVQHNIVDERLYGRAVIQEGAFESAYLDTDLTSFKAKLVSRLKKHLRAAE